MVDSLAVKITDQFAEVKGAEYKGPEITAQHDPRMNVERTPVAANTANAPDLKSGFQQAAPGVVPKTQANVNEAPTGINTGRTLEDQCVSVGDNLELAPTPAATSTLLECCDAAKQFKEAMSVGPQLPEPVVNAEVPRDVEVVADLTPDPNNQVYTAEMAHNNFAPPSPSFG